VALPGPAPTLFAASKPAKGSYALRERRHQTPLCATVVRGLAMRPNAASRRLQLLPPPQRLLLHQPQPLLNPPQRLLPHQPQPQLRQPQPLLQPPQRQSCRPQRPRLPERSRTTRRTSPSVATAVTGFVDFAAAAIPPTPTHPTALTNHSCNPAPRTRMSMRRMATSSRCTAARAELAAKRRSSDQDTDHQVLKSRMCFGMSYEELAGIIRHHRVSQDSLNGQS